MTGAEKIKSMIDSGEFAERMVDWGSCPPELLGRPLLCKQPKNVFGTNGRMCANDGEICRSCWRKALESEVDKCENE